MRKKKAPRSEELFYGKDGKTGYCFFIMDVIAQLTKEWKRRWLILTAFFCAGALWFFYDGFIGYPKVAERYKVYEQVARDAIDRGDAEDMEDPALQLIWEKYAIEQGWKIDKPKNHDEDDFQEQKNFGIGLLVISGGLLVWFVLSHRQRVTFDGTTITAPNGTQVKADQIIDLDKKKWENKGIVYAVYEEGGKRKKLVLDDYKFGGTVEIIDELERRLGKSSGL